MNKLDNDSDPLVDEKGALQRLGGDRQLFCEFISIFMEDSEVLMSELSNGLQNSDAEQVSKSGHALKGLISNFGAKPCVDTAYKLELAGRTGDVSTCDDDFERLKELHSRMKEELQAFV